MNQLLFVWTISFWWFSCLAGLPDCIACFNYFPKCRSRCAHILSSYAECSFLIAPTLLSRIGRLTSAFSFNQCSGYSLLLVFKYCLHSFITCHISWTHYTHYLERTNNQVSSNPSIPIASYSINTTESLKYQL